MSVLAELIGRGSFLKQYADKRGEYASKATTDAGKLKVWRADRLAAKAKYMDQAKKGKIGAKGALAGANHDLKKYRDARNASRNNAKKSWFSRIFSRKKKPESSSNTETETQSRYHERRQQKPEYDGGKKKPGKPLITPGRAAVAAIGYGLYRYHSRLK